MASRGRVRLGDICTVHYGAALARSEREETGVHAVFGSSGVVGTHTKALIEHPTIIIGRKGSVGRVFHAPDGGWPIDTCFYLKPIEPKLMDWQYLSWALRSQRLETLALTTSIPGLSKSDLENVLVNWPAPREQRRIAASLEMAYAIQRARVISIQLLDDLLQAAFLKFFGDPVQNERNWPTAPIDQVAMDVRYGTSTKANVDGRGIPIVRMNNLTTTGRIDLTVIKWCDLSNDEVAKYAVRRGDLLFNRTNSPELVGKTAVWDRDESFAFAGYLIRVRFDESRVLPDFVSHCLNSASGKRLLAATAKPSNNMSNISASELRRLRIPIPPLELQRQFAEIVKRVSILHGRLEAALGTSRDLLSSLYARFFP